MNKKFIFHLALLSLVVNVSAMNLVGDMLGWAKLYSCTVHKCTREEFNENRLPEPAANGTIAIGFPKRVYDKGQVGELASVKDFSYNENQNEALIKLYDDYQEHIAAKITGEALEQFMKEVAGNQCVAIGVASELYEGQLRFIGDSHTKAVKAISPFFQKNLSEALLAANPDLQKVTTMRIALETDGELSKITEPEGSWFSSSLSVSGLTIDRKSAEYLLPLLKEQKDVFRIKITRMPKNDQIATSSIVAPSSDIILGAMYTEEKIRSQFTYVKRMKIALGTLCCAGLVLLGYFKLWQK